VGLFVDAALHPYTWPGEPFQPTRRVRAIRVLATHSREDTDTWAIILCLSAAYFAWRHEQDEIEQKGINDGIDESSPGERPPEG
jgi:hypothetical protein